MKKFPSPIGELHFSIKITAFFGKIIKGGFRPLSGSYISQSLFAYLHDSALPVSVPYRGATFLNQV